MNGTTTALNIHLDPVLPDTWIVAAAISVGIVLLLAALKNRSSIALRLVMFTAFFLALLNPSLLKEQREPTKDVVAVAVDQSPSQNIGQRTQRTERALAHIEEKLAGFKNLEMRIVEAPGGSVIERETRLFDALEQTLADVPTQRRAGVIVLSDGQVHDVPDVKGDEYTYPVHLLLSGDKREKDRQLVITEAPAYGITGQNVNIRFKVEDTDNIRQDTATVTLSSPEGKPDVIFVQPNVEQEIEVPIQHAGQNVFEISTGAVDGEITQSNNASAIIINGVRDRLRVLLVSGQPHAGGRTWRDLLTSDPGVDLVHFTILREPTKLDATPQNELALIAFPFRELFEIKLYEFDLIIFDRYRLNRILPEKYFDNISRYVQEGGALLEASGPSFATEDSIYFTNLMNILPGIPTGEVLRESYNPQISTEGKHHPVTRNLLWTANAEGDAGWGHWLRQVALRHDSGDILMQGARDLPLLILDRVAEGRVAQIASDHIWLWSRGYDGGGPHAELLRRVVHWLMKEPELDERALNITVQKDRIKIESQNYKSPAIEVTVTKPDGSEGLEMLEPSPDGILTKTIEADQLGVYKFEDETGQKRFAIVGDINPPELRGVKTTTEKFSGITGQSGGKVIWLSDTPEPDIQITGGKRFGGSNWLALKSNNAYTVTGVQNTPLFSPWLAALLILSLVIVGWWKEGRNA